MKKEKNSSKLSNEVILWVMIFTQEKNSSTNIFLFIVNNRNTRKRCEICSKLTIKTPQRRSTVFIVNFEHISYLHLFSSVSTVGFEQVNVCWVPPYQFINVDITYCCNY